MPRITEYSFGHIVVDGTQYTSDVIVFPGRVQSSWWRAEGHLLQPADLSGVLEAPPRLLIVGTGRYGVMRVAPATVDLLRERGISLQAEPTAAAVERFNQEEARDGSVVAALHLTC